MSVEAGKVVETNEDNNIEAGDQNMETQEEQTQEEELGYEDMTKTELKKLAKEHNANNDLDQQDPGYIPTSSSKSQIISALEERDALNESTTTKTVRREGTQLPLRQLELNPNNYRHKADYPDEQLQDKIVREGGLLDSIVVRDSGKETDDGETIYWPLNGNRRLYNLEKVVEQLGGDENYEVNVVIREVEGDERQRDIDEIVTIFVANESQHDLSPIDKLHVMEDLYAQGLTQSAIADRLDVSTPYVSQMLKLRRLPERVLDLVHYENNSEFFEKKSADLLEELGVPFDHDLDDGISVEGITLNSAKEILKLYPKKNDDNREQKEARLEEFILNSDWGFSYTHYGDENTVDSGGVLEAARRMPTSQFSDRLEQWAKEEGIIENDDEQPETKQKADGGDEKESTPSNTSEESKDESVEASASEATSDSQTEASPSEVVDEQTGVVEQSGSSDTQEMSDDDKVSVQVLTDALEMGDLVFSDDWERNLLDLLTMKNKDAIRGLLVMFENKVFDIQ